MVFRGIFNNFLFCPSKELWYSNILQNLELCPNLLSKWHFYCIQALEGVQFSKIIKESTYSHLQQKMKSASHGKLMGLRRGTKVPLDSHPSMSPFKRQKGTGQHWPLIKKQPSHLAPSSYWSHSRHSSSLCSSNLALLLHTQQRERTADLLTG